MGKRQVFFNCNRDGVIPISIAIYSLLKAADQKRPLDVFIAHDAGFANRGGCRKISEIVSRFSFAHVHFANFEPLLVQHLETLSIRNMKWPLMVWAWCFCTDLFPEIAGNLVFLDWDMYVLKDLGELYDLDLEGRGFVAAAVNESRREHRPLLVAAGWPEKAGCSINTGTQVINTDAFRREHIREKMLAWYAAHKDIAECVEQDAANVVYGERILRLHLKYNLTVGWYDRILSHNPFRREWRVHPPKMVFEACADPVILHFIGHRKPWVRNHRAYRNLYRSAMKKLGLYDPKTYLYNPRHELIARFFNVYNGIAAGYARVMARIIR